jgi:hypothetical protein
MEGDVYFDGDPEHDSRRRHMERVLKSGPGGPPRRRWPWVLAIVGGGAWAAWRLTHPPTLAKEDPRDSGGQAPTLAKEDARDSGGQGPSSPGGEVTQTAVPANSEQEPEK